MLENSNQFRKNFLQLLWGFILIYFFYFIFLAPIQVEDYEVAKPKIVENFSNSEYYLAKYAPVLFFHEKEKFFPISAEAFLENAALMKRGGFLFFDQTIQAGNITDDLLLKHNSTDYYLKINRNIFSSITASYLLNKNDYPLKVYGLALKVIDENVTYYVLQYWFFYWASEFANTGIILHECDWEVVMFLFDDEMKPLKAGFSQHYYGTVVNWNELIFVEGRPAVLAAKGSHAKSHSPGIRPAFLDRLKRLKIAEDNYSFDILITPRDYELTIFDSSIPWVSFQGYWGLPYAVRLAGPYFRHPRNQSIAMWQNPLGWFAEYENLN